MISLGDKYQVISPSEISPSDPVSELSQNWDQISTNGLRYHVIGGFLYCGKILFFSEMTDDVIVM